MLDETQRQALESYLARYPQRRAGIVHVLQVLQTQYGYIDDDAVHEAARLTGLSTTEVEELATFYSLIYRQPVGRHILQVCDSACCAMNGAMQLLDAALQRAGELSADADAADRVTVLPSICLGLCERAPAALLDGRAVGPLDETALDALLTRLHEEQR